MLIWYNHTPNRYLQQRSRHIESATPTRQFLKKPRLKPPMLLYCTQIRYPVARKAITSKSGFQRCNTLETVIQTTPYFYTVPRFDTEEEEVEAGVGAITPKI